MAIASGIYTVLMDGPRMSLVGGPGRQTEDSVAIQGCKSRGSLRVDVNEDEEKEHMSN